MTAGINALSHCSGRIFNATGLEYSYFPGGDAVGNPHYCHTDYQVSIIAVTDSAGTVVQTANDYPYGEPWREPIEEMFTIGIQGDDEFTENKLREENGSPTRATFTD